MGRRSTNASAASVTALALGLFCAASSASEREPLRSLYPDLKFVPVESADVPLRTVFTGLVQDRDGFLWFTTVAGLLRFDGLQVRPWRFPPAESADGGPTHGQMTEAADGTLWIMSPQGPLRLPPGRLGFERVPMPTPDAARWTWALRTGGGAVWLAHSAGGVYRYDVAANRFAAVFQAPGGAGIAAIPPDAHVDAGGALWLVHANQVWRVTPHDARHLYSQEGARAATRSELDPGRSRLCTPWPERLTCTDAHAQVWASASLPEATCGSGLFDPQGRLLLHCGRNLYLQSADGSALQRVPLDEPLGDAVDAREMAVDPQGVVWLAEAQGLRLIDPDTGASRMLVPGRTPGMLPANGGRYGLMSDNQQGMWVAANGQGVMRASLRPPLFRHWAPPPRDDGRLVNAHVRALWRDDSTAEDDWTLWFSTFDKIQWRLELSQDGQVKSARDYPLPANAVWDERAGFARDGRDRLWFGTAAQLWRFEEATETFELVPVRWPASLQRPLIGGLHRDTAGTLWLYGNFGMARQAGEGPSDWVFHPLPESVTHGLPEDFYIDRLHVGSDGRWWIASERGLLVFDPAPRRWHHVHSRNSALETDWVQGIRESPAGRYWLGLRNGGLQRFEGRAEHYAEATRWQSFGDEHGLTDLMIYDVLPDADGHLWLAGGQGLTRFTPEAGHSQLFFQAEGLRQHDFNRSQSLAGPGGLLLMGGVNGLTLVNPAVLRDPLPPPRPLLTGVTWNRGALTVEDGWVTVPHEGADITVKWLALDFDAPARILYRYRLKSNSPWVMTKGASSAQLAGLGAGRFAFEVQASAGDGRWSESLHLGLAVPPPWWRTPPTVVGAGLVLLLMAWTWKRRRDQQQAELEAEVAARTRDLAGANQQLRVRHDVIDAQAHALQQAVQARDQLFARVSHEFRTPLSLIQLSLDALRKPRDDARAQQDIAAGERYVQELADMVDELLALARGQATDQSPERCDVQQVVAERVAAHQPAAARAGVTLSLGDNPPCEHELAPHALDTVLNNLIGNALKYTPAGGQVQVWVSNADELVIHVKDSGKGIPADFLPNVFMPFARAPDAGRSKVPGYGLGLHLVDLLVRKEGGRVEVDSREGEGSHFRAILPAQPAVGRAAAVQPPATYLLDTHRELRERPDRGAPPGMTLLVIEDNEALRDRLQEVLAAEYRVITAGDGESGLQQARAALPDLVVCDVDLPLRDGFSVCADLKEDPLTSGIPVFFLTAYAGSDHRLLGLKAQGDAYFCKPFAADELRLHIANRLWQQQRLRAYMQDEFAGGERVPARAVVATRDELQLAKARAFHAKVLKLLAKHHARASYNVAALAADLHQDPRHLQRLFSVYSFGMTPKQMLTRYRLARAHEMLQADRHVGKVAEACGLDPKHFSAAFKARYGMLPGEVTAQRRAARSADLADVEQRGTGEHHPR
jgi:signal transduction histidine kinase/DNA-binding response OmpR family regulator/ligand-binding sensor domain-containing protein